jgi:hypothetical protein
MHGTGDELIQAVIRDVYQDVTHTVMDDMREGGAR